MSSGHRHIESAGLGSGAINEFMADSHIQKLADRAKRIDRSHDIPYLGGTSADAETIYLDRGLPEIISWENEGQKQAINPEEYIATHEKWERALMDGRGFNYQTAHKIATAIERRAVLQAGKSWAGYSKALESFIRADEHEKLVKVPKDLDLKPYSDSNDVALLRHLKKIVGDNNGGKATKESARYDVHGTATKHCGKVSAWPHGSCLHFEPPNGCKKVSGYIEPRAVCKYWTEAKGR